MNALSPDSSSRYSSNYSSNYSSPYKFSDNNGLTVYEGDEGEGEGASGGGGEGGEGRGERGEEEGGGDDDDSALLSISPSHMPIAPSYKPIPSKAPPELSLDGKAVLLEMVVNRTVARYEQKAIAL